MLPSAVVRCNLRVLSKSRLPSHRAQWSRPRRQCSSHSTPLRQAPDHRNLGVQQELFTTSIYSPGSPIFLPNGTRIFNRLVDFLRRQYVLHGFQEVITPTIYKKALWAKSGHLENYADDMFTVSSTPPSKDSTTAGVRALNPDEDEYGLKPMNCPGHCLIFASQRRSYRDLPIRYADFSPLHRNEVSGALSGLTRVRRFHQDDGHIFCRPAQVEQEIRRTLDFVRLAYFVFRLGPYRLVLSTRPAAGYMGQAEEWDRAEAALRRALEASGQEWTVAEGEGAFYGPKIDVILRDSDGKEHQTATVQLDFQLPKRFELEYDAPAPELEALGEPTTDPELLAQYGPVRPVLIHRAVLGSVERLMALLIEHYNGKWPFWLNPRQAMILTVNDSAPVVEMARHTRELLLGIPAKSKQEDIDKKSGEKENGGSIRDFDPLVQPSQLAVDLDDSPRSLSLKVREAKAKGYGVIIVIGPRNVSSGTVTLDLSGVPQGNIASEEGQAGKDMEFKPDDALRLLTSMDKSYL